MALQAAMQQTDAAAMQQHQQDRVETMQLMASVEETIQQLEARVGLQPSGEAPGAAMPSALAAMLLRRAWPFGAVLLAAALIALCASSALSSQ